MSPMHEHEVPLSTAQAARVIGDEFPQWRGLDVRLVAGSGTVNRIFRVGDRWSARFPLVVGDPGEQLEYLQVEAAAANELRQWTRSPIPVPVAIGSPTTDYPGHWAVYTWLEGTPAADVDLSGSAAFAHDVAQFIADVRTIPQRGRSFRDGGRGGDLRFNEEWMETCFANSVGLLDVTRLRSIWRELRELPRDGPDVMTHGDVLPGNLLVENDRLIGVLDPGNLGPADPALDLMGLWSLFDDERRDVVRTRLACSDLEWARGRAWAFQQAMGATWYYVESNPTMSAQGRRALDRISST
jgi:aminoglycoside phosphotransferase (APT) family kinase protein